MVTDSIADMLTRIRNANQARHETVSMPYSKMKNDLAEILKNEGFISDCKVEGETAATKAIVITLKYKGNDRVITGLKRVSKPGLRQYVKVDEIPSVLNGLGIAVLSTSKGLMTGKEAKAKNIGGEILAYIW
ncbi:hypothetical protein HMPREF9943_00566 [Eggerthia catenaformis OT 569 = DSM 20559]|uniref:Small ribosomal subunit protein uS8 n=1 Tax=Eggerthia catenaformis OT 569 = DSM 20559 TaxID=999415 RepID=M2Q2R3_9FIRM|nr:30S ribosomal protein S8 [Eggerthia catenaformis]EMD17195.1 hypothetical protein HMPREF9943_00566 [Eggerthia catenaformis OT 569 = DSM 20559]OUC51362.1 30S ribosomal protein S8 [Eggerthia catenaformis]